MTAFNGQCMDFAIVDHQQLITHHLQLADCLAVALQDINLLNHHRFLSGTDAEGLQYLTIVGTDIQDIVDLVIDSLDLRGYCNGRIAVLDAGVGHQRAVVNGHDGVAHGGMRRHETEDLRGQGLGVVHAGTGTWLGNGDSGHFLAVAGHETTDSESSVDVGEIVQADGGTVDAVVGGGKETVEQLPPAHLEDFGNGPNLVKVEEIVASLPWHGALQPGLEVGCQPLAVLSSTVTATDASHTRDAWLLVLGRYRKPTRLLFAEEGKHVGTQRYHIHKLGRYNKPDHAALIWFANCGELRTVEDVDPVHVRGSAVVGAVDVLDDDRVFQLTIALLGEQGHIQLPIDGRIARVDAGRRGNQMFGI